VKESENGYEQKREDEDEEEKYVEDEEVEGFNCKFPFIAALMCDYGK